MTSKWGHFEGLGIRIIYNIYSSFEQNKKARRGQSTVESLRFTLVVLPRFVQSRPGAAQQRCAGSLQGGRGISRTQKEWISMELEMPGTWGRLGQPPNLRTWVLAFAGELGPLTLGEWSLSPWTDSSYYSSQARPKLVRGVTLAKVPPGGWSPGRGDPRKAEGPEGAACGSWFGLERCLQKHGKMDSLGLGLGTDCSNEQCFMFDDKTDNKRSLRKLALERRSRSHAGSSKWCEETGRWGSWYPQDRPKGSERRKDHNRDQHIESSQRRCEIHKFLHFGCLIGTPKPKKEGVMVPDLVYHHNKLQTCYSSKTKTELVAKTPKNPSSSPKTAGLA